MSLLFHIYLYLFAALLSNLKRGKPVKETLGVTERIREEIETDENCHPTGNLHGLYDVHKSNESSFL